MNIFVHFRYLSLNIFKTKALNGVHAIAKNIGLQFVWKVIQ